MGKGKCFVIMGYGVKTDHATGRNLDLDKTYHGIIKPAAEEAGLKCRRADEIRHSGTIDMHMYKQLIEADVVIADLSTSNSNAFYELGVRHALRPKTTIVIAEEELKPPFDINHTIIHQYQHLGVDIGHTEVIRFKKDLIETIHDIVETKDIDSPVYTYLNGLKPPVMFNSDEKFEKDNTDKETLSTIIRSAKDALDENDFMTAKSLFEGAIRIDPNNTYIIQSLALSIYKSKHPTQLESLNTALKVMEKLDLRNTTDPETLGIAGAIYKRLWEEEERKEDLDNSISFYERGFYIKNDYYNGINLAYLLTIRSINQIDEDESITDFVLGNRIRNQVIRICLDLKQSDHFKDRSDQYWIAATLEEAYFGIGEDGKYQEAKKEAISLSKNNWERESTEEQIKKIIQIKEMKQ